MFRISALWGMDGEGRGNCSKRGFCEISSVQIKCLQVSILPALGLEIHVIPQQNKENVILILLQEDVFCFFMFYVICTVISIAPFI